MLNENQLELFRRIAKGIAIQFGTGCEVVVHEVSQRSTSHSIVVLENGHVSGRVLGDGPSQVVLEQLAKSDECPEEPLSCLTRTPDGKLLKSTSIFIPDDKGRTAAILGINFDISVFAMAQQSLNSLISTTQAGTKPPSRITNNVNDLLEDLIEQSVALIGKPVPMMTKDDKVRAVRFLNDRGALLITKSGDKIANHFGISKYTLYSYLDVKTGGKLND